MSKVEKYARILIKRTIIPGLSATTSPSDDHTQLPAWNTSDIYVGEFFLNEPDSKLWIRVNDTSIKKVLFEGDIISISGSTWLEDLNDVDLVTPLIEGQSLVYSGGSWSNIYISGTTGNDGTSGTNGTSGTSGTSGVDGTITGVTVDNKFYYNSGTSILYVPEIDVNNIVLSAITSTGITNFIVADNDGRFYKTLLGSTQDVSVDANNGTTTRTLHFVNGLFVGYSDS